jgi:hypothetical protein
MDSKIIAPNSLLFYILWIILTLLKSIHKPTITFFNKLFFKKKFSKIKFSKIKFSKIKYFKPHIINHHIINIFGACYYGEMS